MVVCCVGFTQVKAQTHIKTAEEFLNAFSSADASASKSGVFYLDNDIYLPDSYGYTPYATFSGTFDGQGFTVYNVKYRIFNTLNSATIKNLGIKNAEIEASGAALYYGILASAINSSTNASSFDNCWIEDSKLQYTYTGTSTKDKYVGSLIGRIDVDNCTVKNCYVKNTTVKAVNCTNVGAVVGYTKTFNATKYSNVWADNVNYEGGKSTVLLVSNQTSVIANCDNSKRPSVDMTKLNNGIASIQASRRFYDYFNLKGTNTALPSTYTKAELDGVTFSGVLSVVNGGKVFIPSAQSGATTSDINSRLRQPDDYPAYSFTGVVIEDGGSLIDNLGYFSSVTMKKKLTVDQWNAVGPMATQSVEDWLFNSQAEDNANEIEVYPYDADANEFVSAIGLHANAEAGQGYLLYVQPNTWDGSGKSYTASGDMTISQTVSPNNSKTFSGTATKGYNGGSEYFLLLSNPFTSVLNASIFNSDDVQGKVIYKNDGVNDKWVKIETDELSSVDIEPACAFLVPVAQNYSVTLEKPSSYNADASTVIKKSSSDLITFNFSSEGKTLRLHAQRDEAASDGFDISDAYAVASTDFDMYFNVDGVRLWKNVFSSQEYISDVTFASDRNTVASLSLESLPANIEVSLIDTYNNTVTVLSENPVSINLENGLTNNYQLKFSKKNVGLSSSVVSADNISVYNIGTEINLKAKNLQRVEIYNTLGQEVYALGLSGESAVFDTDLNEGAYIVKVYANGETKTQKIVVR